MAAAECAKERMERHLRDARLRHDADHIAFWSEALVILGRPIPDYGRSELNQFSLNERAARNARESVRDHEIGRMFFALGTGRFRG